MRNLNFKVSKDIATLLANIAYEHILYNYDYEKALNVYTEGLHMPENLALEAISGKDHCLVLDKDGETISFIDRPKKSNYPIFDCVPTIEKWIDNSINIFHNCEKCLLDLENILISNKSQKYKIYNELSIEDIITIYNGLEEGSLQSIFENLGDSFNFDFDTDRKLEFISEIIPSVFKYIDIFSKKSMTMHWLVDKDLLDKCYSDAIDKFDTNILALYSRVSYISNKYFTKKFDSSLLCTKVYSYITCSLGYNDNKIYPCDITLGYDGGWIDRQGNFYGMNGQYTDNIHIKLSELIFKNKLIEYNKGDFLVNNPDYVVEKNCWVKVHKQNIHYDIYCGDASKTKMIPITNEQISAIVKYGVSCYPTTNMVFGYLYTKMTIYKFMQLDEIQMNKLFEF